MWNLLRCWFDSKCRKVTFTETIAAAVTSHAEKIAELGATNDTFAFADGAGNSYLFIMGAAGNTIAQVGSATITGDVQGASLTITDGERIALNIGGIAWSFRSNNYKSTPLLTRGVFFVQIWDYSDKKEGVSSRFSIST